MSHDEQFWLRHLEAIAAENITIKAYADREGLPVWRLYAQRKKQARQRRASLQVAAVRTQTTASPHAPGFVSVQWAQQPARSIDRTRLEPSPAASACRLQLPGGMSLELPALPDVNWLCQLVCAVPLSTGGL